MPNTITGPTKAQKPQQAICACAHTALSSLPARAHTHTSSSPRKLHKHLAIAGPGLKEGRKVDSSALSPSISSPLRVHGGSPSSPLLPPLSPPLSARKAPRTPASPSLLLSASAFLLPGPPQRRLHPCPPQGLLPGFFSEDFKMKKRQQDIVRFLEANKIDFVEVDITMSEEQRRWMYKNIPKDKQPSQGNPLPPQIFSDDEYRGVILQWDPKCSITLVLRTLHFVL
ncbi:SH3 domain-binding glutamic acid-rich-like protein 2 isoform X2 [Anolis carolinensis]|uniref:SH3 domain-binding glutamic acid-rich-like protein 2 isoform X2 n=1 Tax=Anolis carolinensis TaxID=28377 RepID=UPI002F2B6FDA